MKGGVPSRKPPIKCRIDTYIHKCLRGKSPVFKVVIGKCDADYPRKNHGYEIGEGLFSHFHLLQEQGRGGNAHTGDDEGEEEVARKWDKSCIAIVVGDVGCGKKEECIEKKARRKGEPEHGVVVAVLNRRTIYQSCGKSALLNGGGDE